MIVVGRERFLQIITVSTAHSSMGDALVRRLGSRGGCVWCQLEDEQISEMGMMESLSSFELWASWSCVA